jgi:hypothetical protein
MLQHHLNSLVLYPQNEISGAVRKYKIGIRFPGPFSGPPSVYSAALFGKIFGLFLLYEVEQRLKISIIPPKLLSEQAGAVFAPRMQMKTHDRSSVWLQ